MISLNMVKLVCRKRDLNLFASKRGWISPFNVIILNNEAALLELPFA